MTVVEVAHDDAHLVLVAERKAELLGIGDGGGLEGCLLEHPGVVGVDVARVHAEAADLVGGLGHARVSLRRVNALAPRKDSPCRVRPDHGGRARR